MKHMNSQELYYIYNILLKIDWKVVRENGHLKFIGIDNECDIFILPHDTFTSPHDTYVSPPTNQYDRILLKYSVHENIDKYVE